MVPGDIVALTIFHVDRTMIAATEEVTEVIVGALNRRLPLNISGL